MSILTAFLSMPVAAYEPTHSQIDNKSNSFVNYLDDSRYETAWQAMSPLFRTLHDQHQWQKRIQAIRNAYGATTSRKIRRVTHRQVYSNSPDGTYVVVQYETVFSNKAHAVETIVLDCQEQDECSVREYIIN